MKKHFLSLLLVGLALGVTGCTQTAKTPTLESIAVSGSYKTEYQLNEDYDPAGLIVRATYSNNKTKRVTDFTVTGFDSSVVNPALPLTVSYTEKEITKTTTFNVAIVEGSNPIGPAHVTVTISVNVSGIQTYENDHELIYVNGSIIPGEGSTWGTLPMTQDQENSNLWSITVEDVEVDQSYEMDFYYGTSEGGPDWTYGKNVMAVDTMKHQAVVTEETTSFTFDATFNVKEFITKTFDFVITPKVQKSKGAELEDVQEGIYVWAWSNNENAVVPFTKNEDGTWHREITAKLAVTRNEQGELVRAEGKLQATFVLGTSETKAPTNWAYQMGEYDDSGKFVVWGNGQEIVVNNESATEQRYRNAKGEEVYVYFNGQPEPVDPATSYSLTVRVTYTDSDFTWGGFLANTTSQWVGDSLTWIDNATLENGVMSYTYETTAQEFYFGFKVGKWTADSGTWENGYIGADSSWSAFHVTLEDMETPATIELSVSNVKATGIHVATVVSCTGAALA